MSTLIPNETYAYFSLFFEKYLLKNLRKSKKKNINKTFENCMNLKTIKNPEKEFKNKKP